MAIAHEIQGRGARSTADVVAGGTTERARPNGLVVYTNNYEVKNYEGIVASDVEGNRNLAIDGTSFPALTANIHDGTDNAYYTASATTGTWTFNSATQANTGTQSIDGSATVNGDAARFDGTSFDPADYSRLCGFIYITSAGSGGGTKALNIQLYDSNNTPLNGTVNIYDYVSLGSLNTWQEFVIPLSVFGNIGNDVDRLDLQVVNTSGQAPNFFLDDISFQSIAGREYSIRPVNGDITQVSRLELMFTATDSTTRSNDINPIGFGFGSALSTGIVFTRDQTGYPVQDFILQTNADLLSFPGAEIAFMIGDGTTASMKFVLPYPVPLELNNLNKDKLTLRVADDLTGNLSVTFTAVAATCRKPDLTSF